MARMFSILIAIIVVSDAAVAQELQFEDAVKAYERGRWGVALDIWGTLAREGDPQSQHQLGFMYQHGALVSKNELESFKWYRLAAQQGYALSQYNLGVTYFQGNSVTQNHVRAYMWLSLAAKQGMVEAEEYRDQVVAIEMTPEQIAEALRLVSEWRLK